MWVRMSLRMRMSMSGRAVHGSLWPGDIPDGDDDTGLESESRSGSDADRLVLSLLGGAILTLTVGRHQSLWRRQAGLTGWPIHSCKLNSADHESVSLLT